MDEREAFAIIGQFPHCDPRILHKPKTCQYCDAHPDWQALRIVYRINFTGEEDPEKSPCPSVRDRSLSKVHRWPGNRPTIDGVTALPDPEPEPLSIWERLRQRK